MNTIRAAIFDLDGTVLDSMGVWDVINADFLAARGIAAPPDYLQIVSSMGFMDSARYIKKRFCLPETPEAIYAHFIDASQVYYRENVGLKPNAAAFLRGLKARGYTLGVATASLPRVYMPALERLAIAPYFSAFVSADDVSRGKEYPDIYLEAARRLNALPEECVVFEDILSGARSAKSAGMAVVGVFDHSAAHDRERIQAVADRFIFNYAEILDAGLMEICRR